MCLRSRRQLTPPPLSESLYNVASRRTRLSAAYVLRQSAAVTLTLVVCGLRRFSLRVDSVQLSLR